MAKTRETHLLELHYYNVRDYFRETGDHHGADFASWLLRHGYDDLNQEQKTDLLVWFIKNYID